jgi:hypothetical protein
MAVRAKFKVTSVEYTESYYEKGGPPLATISMTPVYSNDPESENHKFWKASPSGQLKLGTINPEAAKQFELGKEYYLDFTPATPAGE